MYLAAKISNSSLLRPSTFRYAYWKSDSGTRVAPTKVLVLVLACLILGCFVHLAVFMPLIRLEGRARVPTYKEGNNMHSVILCVYIYIHM